MWHGIVGHDDIAEQFRRTLAAGRLASTYLFVGPPGIGKRRFAMELAHALLCTEMPEATLEPCGRCDSCRMFVAGNHPDLDVVGLPPDKATLPIELFIGDENIGIKKDCVTGSDCGRFLDGTKWPSWMMRITSAFRARTALLKTLEEPPPSALLILIGTSPSRQLPTIRSRSQVVRFHPLDRETIAQILMNTGTIADRELALRVGDLSEGSVERAVELADPALWSFRDQLFVALGAARVDSVRLTRMIQAFVEEAGKEPAQRRVRLRVVIGFAVEFYRLRLRDEQAPDANSAVRALDACLTALENIDRNANVGLVVQAWCEGLAETTGRGVRSHRPSVHSS